MILLKFKTPIIDSKGVEVEKSDLGELLSNTLMISTARPPLVTKFFSWALELNKSGSILLDDTDKKSLQEFIESSDSLTVLAKGRLLEIFDQAEQEVKDKSKELTQETEVSN